MHERQKMKRAVDELGGDCAADSHGSLAANYSTLANLHLLLWNQRIQWHLCQTKPKTDFETENMSLNNHKSFHIHS